MKVLVDTNVLLRWSDADSPRHEECVEAVNLLIDRGCQVCACSQVLIEYWVTATRPLDVNGFGLSFAHAERNLAQVRGAFPSLAEPTNMVDRWQQVVAQYRVMGRQAYDARIVALMQAHNIAHLITLNADDFARYLGVTPIAPSQAESHFPASQ